MAVRGGLTRFARPAGSPLTAFVVCPTGCASCRTPVGASHPPWSALCEKKLALSYELFFKYGGEGGIRTPDTLPYTHFPGVLLQPLGHLTKLFCRLTSWGQRGATIGSWSKTVKKNFNDTATTEIYTLSLHDALPILSEWLKEHAWKVCIRQRIGGSNPPLTAIFKDRKSTRLNSSHP